MKRFCISGIALLFFIFSGCRNEYPKNVIEAPANVDWPVFIAAVTNESTKSVGIIIDGRKFAKTEFVTVISKGRQALIPDGKNCTPIDDLFLENRQITLNHFDMCRFEVTQELYEAVMGKVPFADSENCYAGEKQKLRPVAGVSWNEAVVFCNKLSELCRFEPVYEISNIKYANKGKQNEYISSMTVTWNFDRNGFRLPTEAEWEFASRGAGCSAADWSYRYSGGDNSKKVAWTSMNSSSYSDDDETLRTHEVGLKKANALGIYDMSGNVAEWCMDWYRSITEDNDFSHSNAVKDSGETTDPCLLKGKYDNHSLRGGAYNQAPGYSSNWQRLGNASYVCYAMDGSSAQGIRLVRRP